MHLDAMDAIAPSTQALMACLGEPSRFRLVQVLVRGARCVTELAAEVGLSQSCTTRHLQALERRRVVVGTREGKRVMYRLRREEPRLDPLLAWALRARPETGGGSTNAPGATAAPAARAARAGPRATVRPPDEPAPGTEAAGRSSSPASADPRAVEAARAGNPQLPDERPLRGRAARGDLEDYLL